MMASATRSSSRSQRLTTTVVAVGTRPRARENRAPNRDLPEQERRQQQAQAGEIADVSVADRNAHLRASKQEDPSQAAQREAGDGEGRSRGERRPRIAASARPARRRAAEDERRRRSGR